MKIAIEREQSQACLSYAERERFRRSQKKATMKKGKIIEVAVKVIVAALTAFLTAITTTSCMGFGPIH